MIEHEIDDLKLDSKWGKTCESFLNMVDNCLKDHQGIAPDPMQYPDSWYITHLNQTLKTHTTLYQYIVNHQMQATSIANHLGTTSATVLSYESFVETICTFCQTFDHANHKAVQEKNCHKPLQAEFQKAGGCGHRGQQTSQGGGCSDRGGYASVLHPMHGRRETFA